MISDPAYHQQDTAMCATGQSGGANQLAYTLTHYGMEGDYQSVIFTSGPPYSDLELGCGSCGEEVGCFSAKGRWRLDTAYGTPAHPPFEFFCKVASEAETCAADTFPTSLCINHKHEVPPVDDDFAAALPKDSVVADGRDYSYSDSGLPVFFIFGLDDNSAAKHQGLIYKDVLVSQGNNVTFDDLVGVPHQVNQDADGTAKILEDVLASCFLP